MSEHYEVLIVGGGHGGAAAAMALRQAGFAGSLAIAGAEPELPYDRPPLSKDYLAGDKEFERMVFRSAAAWAEKGIVLLPGTQVTAVDAGAHRVATGDGETIGYRQLIWAAGGLPLRLPCGGAELDGVCSIRSRADVDRIKAQLPAARRVVVVGGGYIGLEAAAVLTRLGKHVTLVEARSRVLNRVAAEPLSRFFEAEHRARGVDVRLSAAVQQIAGSRAVEALRLDSGEELPADLVIVGIGIAPAAEPLRTTGAAYGNGVRIDAQCRTSLPDIYAIGDCAEHRSLYVGGDWVRLESVQNATDQATVAARTICGQEASYDAVPWFWSNQYDLRLQTVGLGRGHDAIVTRGDPATRSFSLIYLREGRVVALDCVNATRDYVQGRALVVAGASPDPAALADSAIPLKSLTEGKGGGAG